MFMTPQACLEARAEYPRHKPYDPNGGRKYMTYVPAWA